MTKELDNAIEDDSLSEETTPSSFSGEFRQISTTISLEDCTLDNFLDVAQDERNDDTDMFVPCSSIPEGNAPNQVEKYHKDDVHTSPRSVAHCTRLGTVDDALVGVETGAYCPALHNFDVETQKMAGSMKDHQRISHEMAVLGREITVANLETLPSQDIFELAKQAEERDVENGVLNVTQQTSLTVDQFLTPAEVVSIQEGEDHTDDEDITLDLIGQARREMQALQLFIASQGSRRQVQDDVEQARSANVGDLFPSTPTPTADAQEDGPKSAEMQSARNSNKKYHRSFILVVILGTLLLLSLVGVFIATLFAVGVLPLGDNGSTHNQPTTTTTNASNQIPQQTEPPTNLTMTPEPALPCSEAKWVQVGQSINGTTASDQELLGATLAVSADGRRLAVASSPGGNDTENESGFIQVYELDSSNGMWLHLGDAININDNPYDNVIDATYSMSISYDGSFLAIGSPSANVVRVFRWFNGAWIQAGSAIQGRTTSSSGAGNSTLQAFGYALALSGDGSTVAISSLEHINGTGILGVVQTYQYNGGLEWIQSWGDAAFVTSNEVDDDMGSAVALSYDGSIMAIGAPSHEDNLGVVYVYKLGEVERSWNLIGQPIVGPEAQGRFGKAVDLSKAGNFLAIGAPGSNAIATDSGVAQAFEFDGISWNPVAGALGGDSRDDQLGNTVGISADGSRVAAGGFSLVAAVAIMDYNIGQWLPLGQTIEPDALPRSTAYAVVFSRDGSTLAFGDPSFNNNRGQVRIFQLENCNSLAT